MILPYHKSRYWIPLRRSRTPTWKPLKMGMYWGGSLLIFRMRWITTRPSWGPKSSWATANTSHRAWAVPKWWKVVMLSRRTSWDNQTKYPIRQAFWINIIPMAALKTRCKTDRRSIFLSLRCFNPCSQCQVKSWVLAASWRVKPAK